MAIAKKNAQAPKTNNTLHRIAYLTLNQLPSKIVVYVEILQLA